MGEKSRKVIAVFSEREREDFFPGTLWEKLSGLEDFKWIETPLESGDFEKILLDVNPDILISCWSTPGLPLNLRGRINLRYVCHLAGTVRSKIPVEYIEDGLVVTNWGNSISHTVAESALLLMLMTLRRATHWALKMHIEKGWKGPSDYNESLFGKKVGIHGLGAIGRSLVSLLRPFNVEISAYSPSVPEEIFNRLNIKRERDIEALFRTSQVLVELAAATPANYHIVDEKLLRMLPSGASFVNVGRGKVVDEKALARIASEGKLLLGLDVYETEPLPEDSPLRTLDNVSLFPHMAGPTIDQKFEAGKAGLENLFRYLSGQNLDFVVDKAAYERAT